MTRRALVLASAALACALQAIPARAEPPAVAPEQRAVDDTVPPAPQTKERTWYGWQGLGTDALSMATIYTAAGTARIYPGLAGYGLGAPISHLAHGNGLEALGSLGLHAAGAVGAFYAAVGIGCHEDERERQVDCSGAFVGAMTVLGIASVIDAGLLAYATPRPPSAEPAPERAPSRHERAPEREHPSHAREATLHVVPTLGASPGGVFVGAAGSF